MEYIDSMREVARSRYREIYDGIEELQFFDFPDYPNVGDSAIALGQLNFFKHSNITVTSAYCIGTINTRALNYPIDAVINGGGNIAGFFDGIDSHRNGIAMNLNTKSTLIQAPQSIHFKTEAAQHQFEKEFASRPGLRMSVRDNDALNEIVSTLPNTVLAPDAVHHLGAIRSNLPTQKIRILARRDQESSLGSVPIGSVDWNKDEKRIRRGTGLRWKAKYFGKLGYFLNLSVDGWAQLAQHRLDRGVATLSPGEIVVTDRLHAMLIALQMGRTVHAVDNNNKKLTKYADTWFGPTNPDVKFYNTFGSAVSAAQ